MQGSGEAYQQLISRISETLPDIASQVRDEVGRGRVVPGSRLSDADREARETRMQEAKVGRIAKADVASVDYTDDQKLALLLDGLMRAAATMQSSREAISELGGELAAQPLVFEEPDGTGHAEILLTEETPTARRVSATVIGLLASALEELGGTP